MITTIEDFIEAVPKEGWYLYGDRSWIRRHTDPSKKHRYECPVSSLCDTRPFCAEEAVFKGLIEDNLARRIAAAADNDALCSVEIRQKLLDALVFKSGSSDALAGVRT